MANELSFEQQVCVVFQSFTSGLKVIQSNMLLWVSSISILNSCYWQCVLCVLWCFSGRSWWSPHPLTVWKFCWTPLARCETAQRTTAAAAVTSAAYLTESWTPLVVWFVILHFFNILCLLHFTLLFTLVLHCISFTLLSLLSMWSVFTHFFCIFKTCLTPLPSTVEWKEYHHQN